MKEPREVKRVRPEEHASRSACSHGKTEEPLERRGARSPPQPARIPDLRGGGEEHSDEDHGGDQSHG